jgi:NADP-dependent 3-hydroxy acid dehydrogenase YdfG
MSRVLVTGASKGIGRATVRELTARGHDVVATARSLAALQDLPAAARLALDVTNQESVDAALAAAGELDALISNAGETLRAPAESVPLTEVSRLFQLNTVGALRVAQAVRPGMRARGRGRLLFISSITGRVVVPLGGAYAASKWALEALAEAIAIEAGHFGVKVTLLEPGAVSSGGSERAATLLGDDDPYLPLARQLAAARADSITVEEVAQAVADTLEDPDPPLRLPVGPAAATLLAARHATADNVPFRIAPLLW